MKDGDLRSLFRQRLPQFQWTSVETAGTASGVPDSEYCAQNGTQGWVEFKHTNIYYVNISPFQVAWLMRRCRYGGNAWIAVRRTPQSKRDWGVDELWLMRGDQAEELLKKGLEGIYADCWEGGPSKWNYQQIAELLSHKSNLPST